MTKNLLGFAVLRYLAEERSTFGRILTRLGPFGSLGRASSVIEICFLVLHRLKRFQLS